MTAIVKKNNQYLVDFGTHELVFDHFGHYLGQWQESVHYSGRTFIEYHPRRFYVAGLTHEEMTTLEFSSR